MPVTYTPKKGLAKPIRDSIPPTKFILKDHLNDNWDRLDNDTADNVAEIITEQWDFQGGALFRGIPWFDVRSYGALADGSDDTAHIQAAIDAAEAAGGGSVFIPYGLYVLDGGLTVDGVSLEGNGILYFTGSNTIAVTNTANRKFHFSGFGITGPSATAITMVDVANMDIVFVRIYNCTYGVWATACSKVRIRDCDFDNIIHSGIFFTTSCYDILIVGNRLNDVATSGSASIAKGIGFCGLVGGVTVTCYNLLIMDNILNNTGLLAIELWGSVEKSKVIGNIINGTGQNSGWGISLDTCNRCICSNNKVVAGTNTITWGCELAASSENVIEGNLFDGGAYGIVCTAVGSHDNRIEDNIIMNSSSEGIRLAGYDNIAEDNKIFLATGILLHNFGGAGNMFIGNKGKTSSISSGACVFNDLGTCVIKGNDLTSRYDPDTGAWVSALSYGRIQVTISADADDDTIIDSVYHEIAEGDRVYFTSTGTLPAPLIPYEYYFIISTGVNSIYKLALSKSDSCAGRNMDLTDAGAGVHTMTRNSVLTIRDGNRLGGGFGFVQNVSNGVVLHEEIGYVGVDRNEDTISNENFIPFWSNNVSMKKFCFRTDAAGGIRFKHKHISGGQPVHSIFCFWSGRNNDIPKGGFILLSWGTYTGSAYNVEPTSAQIGDTVVIDSVAYDGDGYPYWDVHCPVNANLTCGLEIHGYGAASSLIDMSLI